MLEQVHVVAHPTPLHPWAPQIENAPVSCAACRFSIHVAWRRVASLPRCQACIVSNWTAFMWGPGSGGTTPRGDRRGSDRGFSEWFGESMARVTEKFPMTLRVDGRLTYIHP